MQHTFNGPALVLALGIELRKKLRDRPLIRFKATFTEITLGIIASSFGTLQSATDPAAKVAELQEINVLNLSV